MTTHLTNYFSYLASKVGGRCENITVVVDNAHSPCHHEEQEEEQLEALNQSMSDFSSASLPPRFPMHTSRWESSEGCDKNSDVCLCVPSRSRDVLVNKTSDDSHSSNNKNGNKIHSRRSSLNRPTPSLDTVEKQLKKFTPRQTIKTTSISIKRRSWRSPLKSPPASPTNTAPKTHQKDIPQFAPHDKTVSERYPFLSIRILSDEPDTSVTCKNNEKSDLFNASKRNQHQHKSSRNPSSNIAKSLERRHKHTMVTRMQ